MMKSTIFMIKRRARHQSAVAEMARETALEMISMTINLNVVEHIQIGSNFGHKVVLGLAVVRLHIILINMIVAMDP